MRRPLGMRLVLGVLVVTAMLPALGVAVLSAVLDRREALAHAREELAIVAGLAAARHEKQVEGVRHLLAAAASSDALRRLDPEACTAQLDRLRASGDYASIGLVDRGGDARCRRADLPGINVADRPFFRRAMTSGRFSSGTYLVSRLSGQAVITFAMPVAVDPRAPVGVVYASLDLRALQSTLRDVPAMPGLLLQLTDADGTLLASNQSDISSLGAPLGHPELLQAVRARQPGPVEAAAPGGRHWLHVVTPVGQGAGDGLYVVASLRADGVLAQSLLRLERALLLLLTALVLGVLAAWWLGRRLVQQPVDALLDRVRSLGRGAPGAAAVLPAAGPARTVEYQRLDGALRQLGERLAAREAERDALLAETQQQSARFLEAQRLARITWFEVTLAEGRIEAPPFLAELTGLPTPARIADALALVDEAQRQRLRQALDAALAGDGAFEAEFRITRPDGHEIWLHALGEIDGGMGQPRRLVGAVQDVSERHRAEQSVREHQLRLEAVVSAGRIGTYDRDLRTGHAVWLGDHVRMWGYGPGEFDGTWDMFLGRIHPDDAERVKAELERCLRERLPFYVEYRVVWPDASVHWVVDSGNTVRDEAGQPLRQLGVVMDVTAQREAQLELERMGRRIRSVLESTSDGFISVDRDWLITYVNQQGARMLDTTAEALLGHSLLASFPGIEDTVFGRTWAASMADRQPRRIEACYEVWNRWFEEHAYPTEEGLSIFFRDITERKRAEADSLALVERLQALREMDRALLQVASIEDVARLGLARMCGLLHCDRASYMGYSDNGAAVGVVWTQGAAAPVFAPGESLPLADAGADLLQTLARGEPLVVDDLAAAPQDTPMMARIAAHGIRSLLGLPLLVDGRLVGCAVMWTRAPHHFDDKRRAIAEGIVDRLRIAVEQLTMRQRIDRHAAELEQRVADRTADVLAANRELEAFSYSVSHDLRAPLQTVSGFSQALLARHAAQLDEKARHYLERINAGAQQMERLIADLLSLAQVTHAEMRTRPVDMAAIARELIGRLRDQHPGRDVEVVLPATLPAWGDRILLHVMLGNLLGNAWKFTGRTEHARIELGDELAPDGTRVFFVADNGVGFDMQHVGRLFKAFRRLHSVKDFPGTGIGLATVARIVARHGGRVWAESEPGVRTVLRFTLAEPAAATRQSP